MRGKLLSHHRIDRSGMGRHRLPHRLRPRPLPRILAMPPGVLSPRMIAGSFAQYEKARLVHKLAAARARTKALTGRCGGRKPLAGRDRVVALAEMHRQRMSLRKISAALAEQGHVTGGGKPYTANAVQTMLRHEKSRPPQRWRSGVSDSRCRTRAWRVSLAAWLRRKKPLPIWNAFVKL